MSLVLFVANSGTLALDSQPMLTFGPYGRVESFYQKFGYEVRNILGVEFT